jgi:hypothetical protein
VSGPVRSFLFNPSAAVAFAVVVVLLLFCMGGTM